MIGTKWIVFSDCNGMYCNLLVIVKKEKFESYRFVNQENIAICGVTLCYSLTFSSTGAIVCFIFIFLFILYWFLSCILCMNFINHLVPLFVWFACYCMLLASGCIMFIFTEYKYKLKSTYLIGTSFLFIHLSSQRLHSNIIRHHRRI